MSEIGTRRVYVRPNPITIYPGEIARISGQVKRSSGTPVTIYVERVVVEPAPGVRMWVRRWMYRLVYQWVPRRWMTPVKLAVTSLRMRRGKEDSTIH